MPKLSERLDQGIATAKDPYMLQPGEMQQATHCYYRPGDPRRLFKVHGRTRFGVVSQNSQVLGVRVLQFDNGNDLVGALVGTAFYAAELADLIPAFTNRKSGLNSSATHLSAVHYSDRHFLCNGYENWVLEDDGTVRDMGMQTPTQPPVVASIGSGILTSTYPTTFDVTGEAWTNEAAAYDSADDATYASVVVDENNTTTDAILSGWASKTANDRVLRISYAINGPAYGDEVGPGASTPPPVDEKGQAGDVGVQVGQTFFVLVRIRVSTDGGFNYTDYVGTIFQSPRPRSDFLVDIGDAVDEEDLRVRVTLTYLGGGGKVIFKLHDVRVNEGSPTADFSTDQGGMYYAYAEFDEDTLQLSPPSESVLVNLTAQNRVELELPATPENSRTTHYHIYRTYDGGTSPQDLGKIGEKIITGSTVTFRDDFVRYDKDTAPRPLLPFVSISVEGGTIRVPRDQAPPAFSRLRIFRGALVGLSRYSPRALYYSAAGLPESWPAINVISAFPMEEHDTLVDIIEIGEVLLIGAKGLMMRTERLPRVVFGTFDASEVVPIAGAPGVVGPYALTSYSVQGEPKAAWISQFGIYITNSQQVACISRDLAWSDDLERLDKSNWVLRWDAKRLCLVFCYSSLGGATNNRYYLFHMAPEHQKANGQPKVTGPHYGEITDAHGAEVAGRYRLYSAHPSDGSVYLEDDDTAANDDSGAYNTDGDLPVIVRTRRIYADGDAFSVLNASVRHTDFGPGASATVEWTAGRDNPDRTTTRHLTVSMAGSRSSVFGVARLGEWHEALITYSGNGQGALLDVRAMFNRFGESGELKAVNG